MRIDPAQQAEAEAAIARVLQAERDAEAEFARCKAECAAEVARARQEAERIAARTERRIALLNRRKAAAIEKRILELDAALPRDTAGAGGQEESAALMGAAETLARELTGAER
jgi:hypothetical protein